MTFKSNTKKDAHTKMSSAVILATAGYDHKIRFWEAPTGVCSRSLRYPDSQVREVKFG